MNKALLKKIFGISLIVLSIGLFYFIPKYSAFLIALGCFSMAFALLSKRFVNVAVVACSLVGSLGIAEVVLIQLDENNPPHFNSAHIQKSYGANYFRPGKTGTTGIPGIHRVTESTDDGQKIYNVNYTIGENGYRVTPDQQLANQPRVNFYGCSFTFGEGLEDNQTLPYFFSQLQKKFYVQNYAFHSYGVHQPLSQLKVDQSPAGTTNILVTSVWHAERSACLQAYTAKSPKYELIDGHPQQVGTCAPFDVTFLGTRLLSKTYSLAKRSYYRFYKEKFVELYIALVVEMNNLSKEKGQNFIVGYIQDFNENSEPLPIDERVTKAFNEKGIKIVNLSLDPKEKKYYIHDLDRHPSEVANQERAKKLVAALFNSH